ncbi:heme-binding protein [uncultured Microbacterium sp.]|uniref:GlcG/HbpS family heme-binding protein n=1 Tax=uncultured Microbacterium sp. TaxID=191216 RepID=UPI0028D22EEC|nr:heme-binding protein [uncultured Microbacterium sp.]
MNQGRTGDVSLSVARALIQRAIDKGEQLHLAGGIAVVGASGALVSASRMDRGGAGGMARARSKAWISATQQIPSAEHLKRMNFVSPPVEKGFVGASPEAIFPGAGGMPLHEGNVVVGGIAASGATVSPFIPAGIEQRMLIAHGRPANPEDLVIHYAIDRPYVGQHGDDYEKWGRAFGEWTDVDDEGLGMAVAPRASAQTEHDWAIALADAVIAEASGRGIRVAVSIVDHRGDPVQQDCMDGTATSATFLATATAATAATFQLPSDEVGEQFAGHLDRIAVTLPFPLLTTAGATPIWEDGMCVGGLGVAGVAPATAAAIVRSALGA